LFVDYVGRLIAASIVDVEVVRLEAQRQGSGFVDVLDGRTTTPDGVVPPSHIIGAVPVDDEEPVWLQRHHHPRAVGASESAT
jgi:hypothetical protein